MNRADLEQLPAGTDLLRQIRYMRDEDFDGITDDELEIAVRWLHAAAYSCNEGARRIERLTIQRKKAETCSDSPPSTPATNTTTAAPPTDTSLATDPTSPSSTTETAT